MQVAQLITQLKGLQQRKTKLARIADNKEKEAYKIQQEKEKAEMEKRKKIPKKLEYIRQGLIKKKKAGGFAAKKAPAKE